jgi:hypothetical protein
MHSVSPEAKTPELVFLKRWSDMMNASPLIVEFLFESALGRLPLGSVDELNGVHCAGRLQSAAVIYVLARGMPMDE